MEVVIYIGFVMIGLAFALFVLDFLAYAGKKMNEGFGMIWFLIAFGFLVLGIVLLMTEKPQTVCMIAVIFGLMLVFLIFKATKTVSVLVMKTQELAMQVSLLNQENERILQEMADMKEQARDD